MASVRQMENYFNSMAHGKVKPSQMYMINQKGRGIGNSRRARSIYKVSQVGGAASIISPVQQGIVQAKKKTGIKRKASSSRSHSKTKRRRVSGKKRKKRGRKKKGRKKKKKKKKGKKGRKRRKKGRRKGRKKKKYDIFD